MNNVSKVGSTSLSHYNQKSSPSVEVALDNISGYKKIKSHTLYIPDSIDLDRILKQHPPEFKYYKDNFVYILSLIISIPAKKKELIDNNGGFTPINKSILQIRIRDYRKYIEYLKGRGIVTESSFYIPGKVSKGLRFTKPYNSKITPVKITKWTLIKSIVYKKWKYNKLTTEELFYLKGWFNEEIEVDFNKGFIYLSNEYIKDVNNLEIKHPMLRFNSRLLALQKLYRKEYNFHVDSTGNRLHTELTQLKSELRNCIKYNGKTLCNIDIVNSQPFLSLALLDKEIFCNSNISNYIINPLLKKSPSFPNMLVKKIVSIENEQDVLLYKELVSTGTFYERFSKILLESNLIPNGTPQEIRNKTKEIAFSAIYSPNTHIGCNKAIQVFQKCFPNVYNIFKLIKKGAGNHATLPIALQRLESDLVLKKACKIISIERPDVPMFTIHDSITTTEENNEYVASVLAKVLKDNIGVVPKLKEELWVDDLIN